uniref:Late embryogenesis abundant protein LEA-2 subgroup domain-containing protein n=1 Tax=Brassica oleracea TaxID=3712 RepID=A0A3P6EU66_BRAOL|nr:unnamed protein product [Brassica oleracea]
MGSPPHSQSSMGRHSRESSSTRVSESQRRLEEERTRRREAVERVREGLLDDGDRDRGVPRRYYVLAFIVGFFILFGLFSLILYGAAKPQKPKITVKSITFETLKIQAGQDAGGVGTDMITMNATLELFRFRLSSPALSIDISDALSVDSGVKNIYYFCQAPREDYFQRAKPYKDHPTTARMQKLAKDLSVVMPVSFFEKSHIPDGPGESSLGLESTRLSFDDIFSILQLYVGINGFPRQLYCFIPLPLALNLKTRDWIRVIIGGVFPAGANVVSY